MNELEEMARRITKNALQMCNTRTVPPPKETKVKDAIEFFKQSDFQTLFNASVDRGYLAERCNSILAERGVKIYTWGTGQAWDNSTYYKENGEVEGLLIDVRPIVRESEERRLLSEAMNYLTRSYPLMNYPDDEKYRADIAERARAVLAKPEASR